MGNIHKKRNWTQCHRCQAFRHGVNTCYGRPRCVKCLDPLLTGLSNKKKQKRQYLSVWSARGSTQLIFINNSQPTRYSEEGNSSSTIDLIISNNVIIQNIKTYSYLTSNHRPVSFEIATNKRKHRRKSIFRRHPMNQNKQELTRQTQLVQTLVEHENTIREGKCQILKRDMRMYGRRLNLERTNLCLEYHKLISRIT